MQIFSKRLSTYKSCLHIMKHVFGTVGLPGSGKSTFADVAGELSENVETTSLGDIVRKLATQEGHTTSDAIGNFANSMREEHGQGIFAEKLIEEMDFDENTILIVDGIRSPEEIEKLRESTACDCTVVHIKVSKRTRYNRIVDRGREDEDQMSYEDFAERDDREISWGFNEIIEDNYYDDVIKNESTLEEFENKIEQMVTEKLNTIST